jgi:hypothetical protein
VVAEDGAEGEVLRFMLMMSMMLSIVELALGVEGDLVGVGVPAKRGSLRRSVRPMRLAVSLSIAESLDSLGT